MVAFVGHAQVQPANFMIGALTFERPVSWKWIDTVTENEKARLLIVDNILKEKAIVSIEVMSAHVAPTFIDKWKEPFLTQQPPPVVKLQTNEVNRYHVVTAEILGTKVVNRQPATNQETHGVVIAVKDELIGARILGARPFVDKLKPVFGRMIKEALKNDE